MITSILNSVKKVLQIAPDDVDFDEDVIMHINSVFSILSELGVGPAEGFMIEDADAEWSDYLHDNNLLNHVKTYMWLRVKVLFDPPPFSFTLASHENQYRELEWRINNARELALSPVVIIP